MIFALYLKLLRTIFVPMKREFDHFLASIRIRFQDIEAFLILNGQISNFFVRDWKPLKVGTQA
jgi:hypothetical protein